MWPKRNKLHAIRQHVLNTVYFLRQNGKTVTHYIRLRFLFYFLRLHRACFQNLSFIVHFILIVVAGIVILFYAGLGLTVFITVHSCVFMLQLLRTKRLFLYSYLVTENSRIFVCIRPNTVYSKNYLAHLY